MQWPTSTYDLKCEYLKKPYLGDIVFYDENYSKVFHLRNKYDVCFIYDVTVQNEAFFAILVGNILA